MKENESNSVRNTTAQFKQGWFYFITFLFEVSCKGLYWFWITPVP